LRNTLLIVEARVFAAESHKVQKSGQNAAVFNHTPNFALTP